MSADAHVVRRPTRDAKLMAAGCLLSLLPFFVAAATGEKPMTVLFGCIAALGLSWTRQFLIPIRLIDHKCAWPTWTRSLSLERTFTREVCLVLPFRFAGYRGWILAVTVDGRPRRAWCTACDDRAKIETMYDEVCKRLL